MATAGGEKALTVDANVFQLCVKWQAGFSLSPREKIILKDFCPCIFESYSIAMNPFIEGEYRALVGPKTYGLWYKTRVEDNLMITVKLGVLPNNIVKSLEDRYGFYCRSAHAKDAKYLRTCLNTTFKFLVTEDGHFFLPHRSRPRRPSMDYFVYEKLGVSVVRIDGCCAELLGKSGE